MDNSSSNHPPSPALIFQTLQAHHQTAALKAGIDLGVFTAIADGAVTVDAISAACAASPKGIRVLCDFLTIMGFVTKTDNRYGLSTDSQIFLNQHSPAYMGGIAKFILDDELTTPFRDLTAVVRKGGTTLPDAGTVSDDNPVWVEFARSMVPMMQMQSQMLPELIGGDVNRPLKVLDIAAGHGIFGIAVAKKFPNAHITALDWANVLTVAHENAVAAGVDGRHTLLPGSAFDVDYGGPYDVILLTNFLHHFPHAQNVELLKKVRAALADGGQAITLEFIPNDDRVTPPMAAGFALTMLGSTANGDAYPFSALDAMFRDAGFSSSTLHPLPPTPQSAVVSHK